MKPYRGNDKNLDYTGSNTPEEEFNWVVEPDSATPHKNQFKLRQVENKDVLLELKRELLDYDLFQGIRAVQR